MAKPTKIFHIILGLLILCAYVYILINADNMSPKLRKDIFLDCTAESCRDIILHASIPLILSVIHFLFAGFLSVTFSPKVSETGERILKVPFYYAMGYFLLFVAGFILTSPLKYIF